MTHEKRSRIVRDPLWYKDAIIYQLHVKSFFDSNNDGVGDFAGLIEKLDYIVEIGVNTVWLLPFYPSPRRDDGYDIAEYRDVHPEYGRLADAKAFIAGAHARGIRVVTELVINHTSDQHPWFQRARRAKPGSAARNFYVWSDTDKKYAGTPIIFCDTEKSNWTWDEFAQAFYWHRFYSHQPDLNFDNPQVLRAVLSVMRFWLDMGVDGLRLDAVPYLIEREGTRNENLPETHQILKAIRAELDQRYPDRMLLAEANLWPEDVRQYFGQGDECHMAFHFPLMPRMYMAIAQEDRFPITDILRQTPEIPENCQWAIFLRNHDELTLETVTDRERDLLWKVYATDRRARLNLGIRRRLAPLMERDRRRIELMNFLLLTMPGTPIIYYGDEIGMGDNLHLGDRDGVRTPMQWSSDRNGGFSRADPESLVLPAIMGSLYGYEAVNVEAQWRDPHSLLNWLRRMLVVRGRHRCFGRGTLRFLRPQNRRVLAYLREYEGETILCVANVSRTAQAVELDLAEFAGRTPCELSAGVSFPAIGQLTYLLTLPPFACYWFELSRDAEPPAWSSATADEVAEYHTFVLRSGLGEIGEAAPRHMLVQDILPAYLVGRRWFRNRGQRVARVEVAAIETLPGIAGEAVYAEIAAERGDGTERYALPLAVAWEDQPQLPFEGPLALARVRKGRRVGLLTDAFATPLFGRAILIGLVDNARLVLGDGSALVFRASPVLASLEPQPDGEIEWPSGEQTNSSLIVGQKAVIKLLRLLVAGPHPEAEMGRVLTERGFHGAPELLGEVVRETPGGESSVLIVVHRFIQNQGDGLAWTMNRLHPVIDEHATPFGESGEQEFESHRVFATTLGRRLGQMHVTLAQPTDDPAFAPEEVDAALADSWAAAACRRLDRAFDLLAARPENSGAAELLARRAEIAGLFPELAKSAVGGICIRVHGDLTLRRVLVAGADVCITGFDGDPAKPLAERRAKSSPMRDLASLIRSFDYAAAAAERGSRLSETGLSGERAQALLGRFREIARDSLLRGYAAGTGAALDQRRLRLLDLLILEQAAREIVAEATTRSASIDIPIRGLAEIAANLLG